MLSKRPKLCPFPAAWGPETTRPQSWAKHHSSPARPGISPSLKSIRGSLISPKSPGHATVYGITVSPSYLSAKGQPLPSDPPEP